MGERPAIIRTRLVAKYEVRSQAAPPVRKSGVAEGLARRGSSLHEWWLTAVWSHSNRRMWACMCIGGAYCLVISVLTALSVGGFVADTRMTLCFRLSCLGVLAGLAVLVVSIVRAVAGASRTRDGVDDGDPVALLMPTDVDATDGLVVDAAAETQRPLDAADAREQDDDGDREQD